MTITAEIILDSISENGVRLTTFQLRYPRFIHSEFMTHRLFSRNASSSRAIPVSKMIDDMRNDPAIPVFWGSNQAGMQAGAELTGEDLRKAQTAWLSGMESAISWVQRMLDANLHKQIANRPLEPWAHINVVVTSSNYSNFFHLRSHPDAQPEIKVLSETMETALAASTPTLLKAGEWHLPYYGIWEEHGDQPEPYDIHGNTLEEAKQISVARCARVSYKTHDGRITTDEEDKALFERLVGSEPLHASPAEHQATPDHLTTSFPTENGTDYYWEKPELHGNFFGWVQFRKTMPNEFIPEDINNGNINPNSNSSNS